MISIHKVAEIRINKGQLICDFIQDFVSYFNSNKNGKEYNNRKKLDNLFMVVLLMASLVALAALWDTS